MSGSEHSFLTSWSTVQTRIAARPRSAGRAREYMTSSNKSTDGSRDQDRSSLLSSPRRAFLGAGATIAGLLGLEAFASEGVLASNGPRAGSNKTRIAYTSVQAATVRTELSGVTSLEDGRAVIDLPDHFSRITSETADLIVQVTPYGGGGLTVTGRSLDRIVVEASGGSGNDQFAYTIKGVRDGYEDRPVVRERPDPAAPNPDDEDVEKRTPRRQPVREHDAGDPPKPQNPRDRDEDDEDDEN